MKLLLAVFISVVSLCLVSSIILPLYFFKWKPTSKRVIAGAANIQLDTIMQLKLIDWTYYGLFRYAPPFETNADGVFLILNPKDLKDLVTVVGNVNSGAKLFEITNCAHGPKYYPDKMDPAVFFDNNIAVATESQIKGKGCQYLSTTNMSQGGFYFSDDGMAIKAGRIKTNPDGTSTLEPLANVKPTSDLSKIPNNWFVIGSPLLNISEYVYSVPELDQSYAGPFVWPLKSTLSTLFSNLEISMYSDRCFLIRIPRTFSQYLFSTPDDIPGLSRTKVCFPLARLLATNALKTGWSILSLTEAQLIVTATTTPLTNVCLYDDSDGLVKYCKFGTNESPDVFTMLTSNLGFQGGVQNCWIVKADTRQKSIPIASDILDFGIVIGTVGSLAPVDPVKTTIEFKSLSGQTTIVNQVTGVTVTTTTGSNGQITTTNQNTGEVTVHKDGIAPIPDKLTAKPSKESFFDKNQMYIYQSIGIASTALVATLVFLLFRRKLIIRSEH